MCCQLIEALEMADIGSSTLYIARSDIMKLKKVSRWIYPLWVLKSLCTVNAYLLCLWIYMYSTLYEKDMVDCSDRVTTVTDVTVV